jgi:peptidoglycan/xylan/chitin deacetylase (PgdA/CDA1 family)
VSLRILGAGLAAALLMAGLGVAREERSLPPPTVRTSSSPPQFAPWVELRELRRSRGSVVSAVARRLVLPARSPARALEVPVLTYHRIGVAPADAAPVTRRLTVRPSELARQLLWLKQAGYRTITQRELYDALELGRPLPPKPLLITFDDGYREVLHTAAPLLERLGMRATAYVVSGRLSAGAPFLDCAEARALERRGIEVGSHTVSHADLTTLGDAGAFRELQAARTALERCLDHPVQWLAYPYGAHDARVVGLARRAGYVLAVTTESGTQQDARAPLELRRLAVSDSTTVAELATALAARP